MTYSSTILADSPQAYYRLDESSGTVAHDSSGNGYDGKLTGVTGYSQSGALVGDSDTSIAFSLSGGLALPSTLNYTVFSAISIEYWMKFVRWDYIVVTCDNTTTVVYLNGAVFTVGSGSSSVQIARLFDVVGSGTANALDEVALYNTVLSPSQITAHYAASGASAYPPALFPSTSRRTGVVPIAIRRAGMYPTSVRRTGAFIPANRRAGTLPSFNRRTGEVVPTNRRGS